MICATLVNTRTHTDSFSPVILLAQPSEIEIGNTMQQNTQEHRQYKRQDVPNDITETVTHI